MSTGSRATKSPRFGIAAAALCVLLAPATLIESAAAEQPKTAPSSAPQFQATDYLMQRLRAGAALDSSTMSIMELRPGLVDEVQLKTYEASTQQEPTDYQVEKLRSGQSWDSDRLSVSELRPGSVDPVQYRAYVATLDQPVGADGAANPTMTLLAALGPQIVPDSEDLMSMQTASAIWGDPGPLPRSHMGGDGVWEFPRHPDQDEQDMLVGQRWRIVEDEDSKVLFLGPDRRFGWDDFADLVNPLQHIPLINIAYRAITGDEIHGAGRLLDVGFGPLAGASTVFELAYESTTGVNPEDQALAMIFGPRGGDNLASLTTASDQLADFRTLRRGSNQ